MEVYEKIITMISSIKQDETNNIRNLDRDQIICFTSIENVKLILVIEEEFDIEILEEDFLFSKFDSINKICKTVEKYLETKIMFKGNC